MGESKSGNPEMARGEDAGSEGELEIACGVARRRRRRRLSSTSMAGVALGAGRMVVLPCWSRRRGFDHHTTP